MLWSLAPAQTATLPKPRPPRSRYSIQYLFAFGELLDLAYWFAPRECRRMAPSVGSCQSGIRESDKIPVISALTDMAVRIRISFPTLGALPLGSQSGNRVTPLYTLVARDIPLGV